MQFQKNFKSLVATFWTGFSKNLFFKIAMSGRVGVGCLASCQGNLLVNLFFSKLYVISILQWIALVYIFGRDEEEDQ